MLTISDRLRRIVAVALFLELLLRRAWAAAVEGAVEVAAEPDASGFLEKLAILLPPPPPPRARANGGDASQPTVRRRQQRGGRVTNVASSTYRIFLCTS